MNLAHLDWPFFEPAHRALAANADRWAEKEATLREHGAGADVDAICRGWVAALGDAGYLRYCVPAQFGGALDALDSRALCVLRETLAYHDGLADFAFAMQGLGSGAITLAAEEITTPHSQWLAQVAQGKAIAAFALSEPDAGSDAAAMTTSARRAGGEWVLDG